jgi:microcystin-dependent protein
MYCTCAYELNIDMPLTKATKDNINSGTAAAGTILAADGVGGAGWTTPTVQTPAGAVMHYAMQTAPDGWLVCNGATVSRLTYSALFAAIGTSYGAGDGVTTFKLPDLRGEFIRGWDGGRGVDGGRAFGTLQADAFKTHNHAITDPGHTHRVADPGHTHAMSQIENFNSIGITRNTDRGGGDNRSTAGPLPSARTGITIASSSTNITIADAGSIETRPRNVALLPCIKY